MNQKVSIIIPYYNGKKYVEEAICSIINQTYDNIEIIIVDDCSSQKEELNFLKRLQKKYDFILVEHPYNSGASRAFFTGVTHSTGRFIAFLGQDDVFLPTKIEKQIACFTENNSIEACYSGFELFDQKTKSKKIFDTRETIEAIQKKQILPSLYKANNFCLTLQGLMIKKEIVDTLCLPIWNKLLLDDWPIHIELFKNIPDKVFFINEVLFSYRVHENNLSKNNYKVFTMVLDVISTLCPDELKDEAFNYHLNLIKPVRSKKIRKKLFKWI